MPTISFLDICFYGCYLNRVKHNKEKYFWCFHSYEINIEVNLY